MIVFLIVVDICAMSDGQLLATDAGRFEEYCSYYYVTSYTQRWMYFEEPARACSSFVVLLEASTTSTLIEYA